MRSDSRLLRSPSRSEAVLIGSLLTLASCDSGARVSASGGDGIGPGGQTENVDFRLRRDFFLAGVDSHNGFLGDMATADLDGDGDVDLVQTNLASQTITIAYGTGFGVLPIVETFDVAGAPLKVVTGDFDGDGDVDIAVAVTDQDFGFPVDDPINGLQVFLQDEDGFAQGAVRELGGSPFDLVAAPFGGGPADDLVVTVPSERRTRWFQYAGGDLLLVQDLMSYVGGAFGRPLEVAAVDLENDGVLDMLVSEDDVEGGLPDRVILHRNVPDEGEGLLLPGAESGVGAALSLFSEFNLQTPLVFALGDVDGDGREDAGVVEFDGNRAFLLSLAEDGALEARELDFGAGILSLDAADLDGNGSVDLMATLWNQGAVAVAYASQPGVFEGVSDILSVGYFPRSVHAIDLDNLDPSNGGVDIVTCNSQDLAYLRNQGESYKTAHGYAASADGSSDGPVEPTALRAEDLNGDGHADVVAVDLHQREIVFLAGDGTGALEHVGSVALAESGEETPGYLLLRDIDGDGDLDLITSVAQNSEIAILRNDGTLPFEITARIEVGQGPRGIGAADFDGDGALDLAVANHGDTTVQVLLGDGAGGFSAQPATEVSAPPLAIMAYDIDSDGDADCVVSTGTGGAQRAFLLALEGDGNGGLDEVFATAMAAQAPVLFCGDFDGDTDGNELCDIVASQAGEFTEKVVIFRNETANGTISFAPQTLDVGLNPGTLDVSDVDRDGDLDLLILLGRGELVVARNNGAGEFPTEDFLPARDPILDQEGELRGWSAPFGTVASALTDLDGDTLEDLILVSLRTPHIWVARNQSTVSL